MWEVLSDVKPMMTLISYFTENGVLRLERRSKIVLSTHIFLWGKVFDTKRGGRNINNRGLKGSVNIEIKVLIFVNVSVYRLY
jgi:hypothetical protein